MWDKNHIGRSMAPVLNFLVNFIIINNHSLNEFYYITRAINKLTSTETTPQHIHRDFFPRCNKMGSFWNAGILMMKYPCD